MRAAALAALALVGCDGTLATATLGDAAPPRVGGDVGVGVADAGAAADAAATGVDARVGEADPWPTDEECAPLRACARECAQLDSDPLNCGVCGRTCVIPNAEAGCRRGRCVVAACDEGFSNQDGEVDTGCESEDGGGGAGGGGGGGCVEGAACETACGSEGAQVCGPEPACPIPAERCNAADDDCDGACDEEPGCRAAIHRGYGNGHLYSDDLGEVTRAPFRLEAEAFFHLYREPVAGMRPVFLCEFPGERRYFLSSDTACGIGRAGRPIGFWSPRALCGSTPLYYLVGGGSDHFYTVSEPEAANARDNLGFEDRGVAGHVWRAP